MSARTITRRILLVGSTASAGAAGLAGRIAGCDPDAELLALGPIWREARAGFDAALAEKATIEARVFARRPVFPSKEAFGSRESYDAAVERFDLSFRAIRAAEELFEIERRERTALEAYHAVVGRIVALRARTIAGLMSKVEISEALDHSDDELLRSIVEDLATRFAGR